MAKWFLEPGHTAAEFCVRHMMVTFVRGAFKNVTGTLVFDPEHPEALVVHARIPAVGLWSGEKDRDAHLQSADFLDVEKHAEIRFDSDAVEVRSGHEYSVSGALTLRGVTRSVTLLVRFLGTWETPWWEDGVDKGPKTRAGFVAKTSLNRHDFGVSWGAELPRGGRVVGDLVEITIDAEAILES